MGQVVDCFRYAGCDFTYSLPRDVVDNIKCRLSHFPDYINCWQCQIIHNANYGLNRAARYRDNWSKNDAAYSKNAAEKRPICASSKRAVRSVLSNLSVQLTMILVTRHGPSNSASTGANNCAYTCGDKHRLSYCCNSGDNCWNEYHVT